MKYSSSWAASVYVRGSSVQHRWLASKDLHGVRHEIPAHTPFDSVANSTVPKISRFSPHFTADPAVAPGLHSLARLRRTSTRGSKWQKKIVDLRQWIA